MTKYGKSYFNYSISNSSDIPSDVREAFRLHHYGQLSEANLSNKKVDLQTVNDRELIAILAADRILLSVKIGQGLPESIPSIVDEFIDSRCILEYARYSYYFWNDHSIAWRSLWKMLLLAPRSSCKPLSLTVFFLMGHMLAIEGKGRIGFPIARFIYKFVTSIKFFSIPKFASNILLSAYPYTLFVTAKLDELKTMSHPFDQNMPSDSYYQNIYIVSRLYAHAYSGDIVQTELYAHKLSLLHQEKKLLRYVPVSKIMPLLPGALRGYADFLKPLFEEILLNHDDSCYDTVINCHFYRASALIALCLDQKDKAKNLIEKAILVRKSSKSFQSWDLIDRKIHQAAVTNGPFNPSVDHIIEIKNNVVPPQLATAFMKIIAISTSGIVDSSDFIKKVAEILGAHFECKTRVVSMVVDPQKPALKLGSDFILFEELPAYRIEPIWAMLNIIAPSVKSLEENIIKIRKTIDRLKEIEKQAAVAQMTQMMAHDVRKPFSMLKTGLNILQSSIGDPDKLQSRMRFLVSEVDRATKSVDGMLSDIMEIGSTSTALIQEPVSPEALFENALGEICRVYPKSKIEFEYNLSHSHLVNVHTKKVSRVFSNIIGNAFQAINYSGKMWFKTEVDGDFVQFTIGNSGSKIPQESLEKLFDAFFTSGKKGGTGLGLAIAQKVVNAHGGKIWCESSQDDEYPSGKVEFIFTLPVAAHIPFSTTTNLPKNSEEITQVLSLTEEGPKSKSESEFNKSEGLLTGELASRLVKIGRPLEILLIDDEPIYSSALSGWIDENNKIKAFINIHSALNSQDALELVKNKNLDLIITDIDMGHFSLSGFEVVKTLRQELHFKGLIYVHSNRIVPDDHKRTFELGADGFLPKPMAKGQLLKLLLLTVS